MKFARHSALAAAILLAAGPAWAGKATLAEGTELPMRLEDSISSKTATEGDRFTISLTEDVKLSDGTILRAGYRGLGEVIEARKSGMIGRTGKLNIRLNYLKVGDQRIKLRAARAAQGNHNTGAQVVTLLFLWPVAPLIKGKSTQLTKGTVITAFADQDVELEVPAPPPPAEL